MTGDYFTGDSLNQVFAAAKNELHTHAELLSEGNRPISRTQPVTCHWATGDDRLNDRQWLLIDINMN